jgi:hypothetical protein
MWLLQGLCTHESAISSNLSCYLYL